MGMLCSCGKLVVSTARMSSCLRFSRSRLIGAESAPSICKRGMHGCQVTATHQSLCHDHTDSTHEQSIDNLDVPQILLYLAARFCFEHLPQPVSRTLALIPVRSLFEIRGFSTHDTSAARYLSVVQAKLLLWHPYKLHQQQRHH